MTETRESRLVISADDRATRTLSQIGRSLSNMARRSGLDRLGRSVGALGRSLGGVARAAGGAVRAIGALAGIGLGGGLAGLVAGLRSSATSIDELSKLSRQVGLTVQDLRELNHIADLQGVGQGTMQSALRRSARNFADMQAGVGRMTSQIKASHPALYEQIKGADDASEAFGMMLNALQQAGDEAERLRLAELFFGSADMGRIAELSNDQIQGLRENFRRLAGEISDEHARGIEDYNDSITELQTAIGGVSDAIISDLAPALTGIIRDMGAWVAENREWLSQEIAETIRDIGFALRSLDWQGTGRSMREFGKSMNEVAESVGGWKWLLGGTLALAFMPLIAALLSATKTIALFGWALASTPIGQIAIAIAAAALLIWRNWDDLGTRLEAMIDAWSELLGGFKDWIVSVFTGDLEGAGEALGRIFSGIGALWESALSIPLGIVRAFATEIDGLFGTDLVGSMDRAGEALSALWDGVTERWDAAVSRIKATLEPWRKWFMDTIIGPIMRAIDRLSNAWSGFTGAASNTWVGRRLGFGDYAEGRARGGPVAAGMPYEVGERGRELFVPGESGAIVPNNIFRRWLDDGLVPGAQGGPIEGSADLTVRFDNAPAGVRASARSDGRLFRRIMLDTGPAMRPAT